MRVIIAEDDALMLDLLVLGFERAGHQVLGQARNVEDLLNLVEATPVDVVVLDMQMPMRPSGGTAEEAGLEAAIRIRQRHPRAGILALSHHRKPHLVEQTVALGTGIGYQLKSQVENLPRLIKITEEVGHGGVKVDDTLVADLFARKRAAQALSELTERETAVLRLVAEGLSTHAIAGRLKFADTVIESCLSAIYRKLGIEPDPGINKRVLAVLRFVQGHGRPVVPALQVLEVLNLTPGDLLAMVRCLRGEAALGTRFRSVTETGSAVDLFLVRILRNGGSVEQLSPGQTAEVRLAGTGGGEVKPTHTLVAQPQRPTP
ncbi:response regulator transcription factor [Streptomyces indiaensis]|uniref:Response regulatory domain-containing protein n=1 Tax=Streptomyces indiaensis TaxID=284033 RepID=A0ABP5Q4C1_9ACTN|nr:response regulator transcription factor [Streptomyces indiaensis]MCF1648485.1 response regulator transcription factor [Streptomyces indiaensis]